MIAKGHGPAWRGAARHRTRRRLGTRTLALLLFALSIGCRQDMHDQARLDTLEPAEFFSDGRSARRPPEGTIPRGGLKEDELLYTGNVNGRPAEVFPFRVTMDIMQRGRERYDIFCSPCHDRLGTGNGIVVQRGFPPAASFHVDRLRNEKPGYYFDVITRGFGRMLGYAQQIPPEDRWAIIAYVRALQASQDAELEDVPAAERERLLAERTQP